MDSRHNSAEVLLRTRLLNKLHPDNFGQMSGKMAAVLGYLLDVSLVHPNITGITVTTDGCEAPPFAVPIAM